MESVHSATRRAAASTSVFVKDDGPEEEPFLKSSSPSKVPSAKKPSPFWQTLRSWFYQKLKTTLLVVFIATNITLSIWIVFMHGNLPEYDWFHRLDLSIHCIHNYFVQQILVIS